MRNICLLFLITVASCLGVPPRSQQEQVVKPTPQWERSEKTDPLREISYAQFTLVGKFLTPPVRSDNPNPVMVVRCIPGRDNKRGVHGYTNGKFREGYIHIGGVMDSTVSGGGEFVSVKYRLDGGKLQDEQWGRSTDFAAIFFSHPTCPLCGSGYDIFANILYGHGMYHKENTNPQVRKVVIGVSEFLGGEVVMQFDMPDATEVAEACGIILHKHIQFVGAEVIADFPEGYMIDETAVSVDDGEPEMLDFWAFIRAKR